VNNLTNKTWQITGGTVVGANWTFTTSAPSNFPVGSQVVLNLPNSGVVNQTFTVTASNDATFTCIINNLFVAIGENSQARSTDNGVTWYDTTQLSGTWYSVAFGNGVFVMVSNDNFQARSTDNGLTWSYATTQLSGSWTRVAFGNGVFVMISYNGNQARSTDNGLTWSYATTQLAGTWYSVAFGNGVFVMVSYDNNHQARSTDNGVTWSYATTQLAGTWTRVAFGNGVFVMVGIDSQARSTDNGVTWSYASTQLSGGWTNMAFGNGVFVVISYDNSQARSTDNGLTWSYDTSQLSGTWHSIAFGNGVFVVISYNGNQARSTDNGLTWSYSTTQLSGAWNSVAFGNFTYTYSLSDSVSLVVRPLSVTNRVLSSDVYTSISFANAADAAFWGFDSREGLTYSLTATPPWTLTQSGWISGFLPPSTSTYDDSVAHKLCKSVRLLVGKQTIKEYSGEYIELQNDLLVPYENKAILKLMNGTLDQTQATVAREYYVNLPLGTKEVPLCALTHQSMSVEIDFDSYLNVSQNLNQGTGSFTDAKSYTTYNASTGILGGQPVNVQTTFSYQQYIFIVTYGGQFIIFDTTKNVDDPASYIVLSAFSGSSLFSQFCVLSGNLYIGLTNGQLARMIITELIQGNISSFIVNNYTPTIGSLTGTIVADFRYVYYTVSNTVSSNVFMTRYDTTGLFTNTGSYTTVDFTKTFNSSITGIYQALSTGTQLIVLPQGTPGKLYTYQLNANVQSQWYVLDYSAYGNKITEGVLLGEELYFILDNFGILKYSSSTFNVFNYFTIIFVMVGPVNFQARSTDNGLTWSYATTQLPGSWTSVAFGNGVFVMVSADNFQARSTDNGLTWSYATTQLSGTWESIEFGNGVFVMVSNDNFQARSTDNGLTWSYATTQLSGTWHSVEFGNGVFVMVSADNFQARSTDNGLTWSYATTQLPGYWNSVAFGNGVFVMVSADNHQARSTDNGVTWSYATTQLSGTWASIEFGNGVFVMVGIGSQARSTDNGLTWTSVAVPISSGFVWTGVSFGNENFVMVNDNFQARSTDNGVTWTQVTNSLSGYWLNSAVSSPVISGLRNLLAVGNYIYASTNNVAIQIDTTKDMSTSEAYNFPAPVPTNQYIFANGPRYVYLFAQGDNTATNIVEFDPYGPDTTFKTSILVDYESLPQEVPKPDKALIGLVQTQKVTDMNYMDIHGPVKELWVTGTPDSANVFQYSNLAPRSTLTLAGEQIVTDDVGTHTFLNIIEPFETHTSMPIRNVSVVSFEFDPESDVPNGTINFSRIRDQVFDGNAETVWARTYNILAIQGGTGGLMFN
jgi:hypothetical protein